MINLSSERLVSLADAPQFLPARRAGKKPHFSCIFRWATIGCRGVVLESLQVGATKCTSVEALQRFCEALTAAAQGNAPAPPLATRHRQSAVQAAERRLAKAGI